MNAPHTSEHIVLGPDEKKVTYITDSQLTKAGTFKFVKEDHTIGNIVRYELLRDPNVLFAGYRMPHPLLNEMVVKIRTTEKSDPVMQMKGAISNLKIQLDTIERQFRDEVSSQNAEPFGFQMQ